MNKSLALIAVLAAGVVGCNRYEITGPGVIGDEAAAAFRLDTRTGQVCAFVVALGSVVDVGCAGAEQ